MGRRPQWKGLDRARVHAARAGRGVVGTEHVLLALCDGAGDEPARRALARAGASREAVGEIIDAVTGGQAPTPPGTLPPGTTPSDAAPPERWGGMIVAPTAGDVLAEAAVLAAARPRGNGARPPTVVTDVDVLTVLLRAPQTGLAGLVLARFDTGAIAHRLEHGDGDER